MIVSASRRTDIPTYYSEWFFNRVKEGYVLVRNPMNAHQISKINLSPDVVDGIVFWTKNPVPMLPKLDLISDYMYYFQFTLTPYAKDVEQNVPAKNDVIIPAFQKLSDMIGPERVIWRYDPILLNRKYTVEYHMRAFEKIAKHLKGYTKKCTISFIDSYRNTVNNTKPLELIGLTTEKMLDLSRTLSEIAHGEGLMIDTCAEKIELQQYDIAHARCVDDKLLENLLGCHLNIEKDRNQRLECGCVASVDIGMYNTCKNGCLYCYANYSAKAVENNFRRHNPLSALLFGEIADDDIIKEREMKSDRNCQLGFFDV